MSRHSGWAESSVAKHRPFLYCGFLQRQLVNARQLNMPLTTSDDRQGPYFLGVDVGGTNIKIGLVNDQGKTLAFESISTNEAEDAFSAIKRCGETCRQLATQAAVDWSHIPRAGLGTPGPLSLGDGILLNPTNLPAWHNFPVRRALENALDKPVSFLNDANAAALGEFWIGAGASEKSMAFLTLGTGVGGGLISEGHLINGTNSFGSEVGHVVVDSRPDARLCVWGGGRGHLEAYASASAVAAQANLGIQSGVNSSLASILADAADGPRAITAKDVYQAALSGDGFALQLIDETAFYLGIGVTCVVHMVDPGLVLLGGAMNFGGSGSPVGKRFLQGVIAEFEQRTFPNVFAGTKIGFAKLAGDAGYIGAAASARQDFHAGK